MKKFKLKKDIPSFWVFLITFTYLELVFKIVAKVNIFSLNTLNNLLFILFFSLVCQFLVSLFSSKIADIILPIIIVMVTIFYSIQIVVYNIFGFYFTFSLLGATNQVLEFAGDMFRLIWQNVLYLIVLFIPTILVFVLSKNIKYNHLSGKKTWVFLPLIFVSYGLFAVSLLIGKNMEASPYKLYYETRNMELSLKRLGVVDSMFLDLERSIFGFNEKITILDNGEEQVVGPNGNEENPITYEYNNLDYDFSSLISKASGTVKSMHQYFENETGTLQNEYTGYFKDKNLILFMAESFNEIAVDPKLTPTLYKLVNNGFVFDNFYTPTISSTIGGEFQEVTGLVAADGFINPWKAGTNSFPFGLGTMFKKAGFLTHAYHDHSYTFQSRYKYLKALGFDNFLGCKNGLETRINCDIWPESDVEMIEATFDDYGTSGKQFFTYYVTVSGHGGYAWSGNNMSKKHRSEVADLPYSEDVKAYLAAQIELDKALELLIQKLSEAGILDDTVIALVGDHYPYMLGVDAVNEVAKAPKDAVIEINHSNFILWNNKMAKVKVSKVGSQIDVLPTLYNIFGLKYDSRLIIGKDILSTEPGLAIFDNRSWVSDKGSYYAASSKFVPRDGVEVEDGYVSYMNKVVGNKINMSKLILTENYYQYF